ncbi:hypothetical protein [Salinarchaeum laminariae]|uniref:hypothetical protein n=1 Tax=Salinarchaeum laminariae TaxID=869888 RepID=UPI0020BDF382|nr:hypothetical protein [Salinarchaeum laminariae]
MFGPEKGFIAYMIFWPLAAPRDAYRAGRRYHVLVGVLASLFPGIPLIVLRFIAGVFMGAANWYRTARFGA